VIIIRNLFRRAVNAPFFSARSLDSDEYLLCARDELPRHFSPPSRFSPSRAPPIFLLLFLSLPPPRGEAAPRASRCFICLSALFITCNLALARARVISYWFSAPFLPSPSPEPSFLRHHRSPFSSSSSAPTALLPL